MSLLPFRGIVYSVKKFSVYKIFKFLEIYKSCLISKLIYKDNSSIETQIFIIYVLMYLCIYVLKIMYVRHIAYKKISHLSMHIGM